MANIPYDLYEILERKLGKEEAKEVAKLIEKSLEKIEEKAKEEKEIVKIQIKEELREELKKELVTKEDILFIQKNLAIVRREPMERIEVMEWKMKLWFLIVIALILLTNKDIFEWLIKFLNFVK